MTQTPDSSKPGQETDPLKDQDTSHDPKEEAEAMEEAQKEGAEQRKEGGYQ